MTKISVNLKFEKMKTKFSTGVFTAWATLFFMILIVDSSAAWYEWSKAAREKLEWDSKEADCRIKIEFEVTTMILRLVFHWMELMWNLNQA
jgi:hypothetical protein